MHARWLRARMASRGDGVVHPIRRRAAKQKSCEERETRWQPLKTRSTPPKCTLDKHHQRARQHDTGSRTHWALPNVSNCMLLFFRKRRHPTIPVLCLVRQHELPLCSLIIAHDLRGSRRPGLSIVIQSFSPPGAFSFHFREPAPPCIALEAISRVWGG
ncbi:uncharacterized protein LY89DRAFT_300263 [Mollisia scopiformis]|uniref:Uncharacterized protein n=1 Tax=Mollisia scopiformis TaxID=149040 RepID=A0A194XRX2_MOLSC|nr:uncharacterized protein LY89DRAFT_300263 [Mollisia scopiformis]KUJ22472.1 hypothetical protein LY89DRAFT_300263 [Mollisia scopiformis]